MAEIRSQNASRNRNSVSPGDGMQQDHGALSAAHRDAIFDVCSELIQARSALHLRACARGRLQSLLGYDSCIFGFGEDVGDGLLPIMVVSHRFSMEYLEQITRDGVLQPQTLHFWRQRREPLSFSFDETMLAQLPAAMTDTVRRYGFSNLLCHGQIDLNSQHISYVTFNGITGGVTSVHHTILTHIMPHLHSSMLWINSTSHAAPRIFGPPGLAEPPVPALAAATAAPPLASDPPADPFAEPLSERKLQILYLLGMGKTNWEIAHILCTSSDNVKYHLKQLNTQFNATSRAALVGEAGRRGFLPMTWPERI